jgi:hypothetical protein
MTTQEEFKINRYIDVKSLLPTDICKIATKYALLKEKVEFAPELGADAQVLGAHSVYGDTLMETLMFFTKPHLEKLTGMELALSYTYYRVYRPGSILARHKDRPSCEISMTTCLGFNYVNPNPDYSWGMYVDADSVNKKLGPNGEFISNNKPGKMIAQQPGDAIVYRGCEVEHWRDRFECGAGSYQVQAFFHFVDKNGPFYPEYEFDKRPGLAYTDTDRIAQQR